MRENFFFIHIAKTAGGSFRRIIDDIYKDDCYRLAGRGPGLETADKNKLLMAKVGSGHVAYSGIRHLGYDFITIVREPYQRFLSHYFYEKKNGLLNGVSPIDFIEMHKNYQYNQLGGNLDNFSFIGIFEFYPEIIERFKLWADIRNSSYRVRHINQSGKVELSSEIKNRFKDKNEKDYQLYRNAVQRWYDEKPVFIERNRKLLQHERQFNH